jgi:hypothetical protein
MGIRTDIRDEIRKETVTKIHGQPTSHDLTNLEREIISILANIPTTLGGGNHGHVGVIMDPTEYNTMTEGTDFVKPVNLGIYPANLRSVLQEQDEFPSAKYGTFTGTKRKNLPRTPKLKRVYWGR